MQDIDIVVHLTSCCQWIVCLVLFPIEFRTSLGTSVLHQMSSIGYSMNILTRNVDNVERSLGACHMVVHWHSRDDVMLFYLTKSLRSNLKTSNVLYLTWFIDTLLNFILIYKQNILTCRTYDWMRILIWCSRFVFYPSNHCKWVFY